MVRGAALIAYLLFFVFPVQADEKEHLIEIGGHQIKVKVMENYDQTSMIRAECVIPRSQRVVWEVLSNYENLASIIPAVATSRVLREEEGDKILLQEGRAGIWFFMRDFSVTFRVKEVPMSYIGFSAFEGDFREFKGSWQVGQREEGTWVSHRVELEPRFFAPKWALHRMARKLLFETIEHVIEQCLETEMSTGGR